MVYEEITGQRGHYGSIPDYDGLLLVLKRFGLFALGGTDGCLCSHFSFRAIFVDIGCRKSEGGHLPEPLTPDFHGTFVRLHCRYIFSRPVDLLPIAQEIVAQLHAESTDVFVRLCEYADDHDNDKPMGKCVYCSKERSNLSDYLCAECLVKTDQFGEKISEQYKLPTDWTGLFICPPDTDSSTVG